MLARDDHRGREAGEIGVQRPERVSVLNLRGYRIPLLSEVGEDFIVEWAKVT